LRNHFWKQVCDRNETVYDVWKWWYNALLKQICKPFIARRQERYQYDRDWLVFKFKVSAMHTHITMALKKANSYSQRFFDFYALDPNRLDVCLNTFASLNQLLHYDVPRCGSINPVSDTCRI